MPALAWMASGDARPSWSAQPSSNSCGEHVCTSPLTATLLFIQGDERPAKPLGQRHVHRVRAAQTSLAGQFGRGARQLGIACTALDDGRHLDPHQVGARHRRAPSLDCRQQALAGRMVRLILTQTSHVDAGICDAHARSRSSEST